MKRNSSENVANVNTASIKNAKNREPIMIKGIVTHVKVCKTQIHGDLAAYITIRDMYGTVEAFLFPDVYEAARDLLKDDNPVVVLGYAERGEDPVKMIAETIRQVDKGEK